ncbi:MAG: sodium:solute symporter [Candidatus Cryptobacteroides sp.]|nr:sodium:solute symporter [Candidatus Cryptobacteroides sp.]
MAKDFYATRSTAWWKVAVAMIGSCLSGVTFVSVPGMVGSVGFGYLQMCVGFFLGYLVIAFVLTPLYFRLNVVSVYQYLEQRFGVSAHKTGAWFFFLSKMLGAAVRLFLMIATLQLLVAGPAGIPFWVTVLVVMLLEWLYTVRGGVKAVIGLDMVKTLSMVVAVALCLVLIAREVGAPDTSLMRVFYFDDVNHPQFFWKQLLGGLFTVVATTGMDQDMMQRTLACKSVRDSQKNLIVSVCLQIVTIALFLFLGVYLYQFAALHGLEAKGDTLFPAVAWSGLLPASGLVATLFIVGLVMAGFPAGGSALTSLTTSFTIDILGGKDSKRSWIHTGMAVLMAVCILVFNALNSTSVIDAVYRLASYTYGPILGLFSFGLLCKAQVRDKWVPVVAIAAPLLCLLLDLNSVRWFGGYHFSYELLLMNAVFTMLGLCLLIRKK